MNNLRWLTPVLLTINLTVLGWLVVEIRAARDYTDKRVDPLFAQAIQINENLTDLKIDMRVIKYRLKLKEDKD